MLNKNNNFDFLRILFSLLVVISHSYPLSGSIVTDEWLCRYTSNQLEYSAIGLNGFFIISGYLIYQSLDRSSNLMDYFWKRMLRIFPGLFVVLLLILLFVPFVYTGSTSLLSNRDYFTYLPRNFFLYNLQYSIDGVFETNIYPSAINGSLWTISYEFTMYIFIMTLFFIKNKKLKSILLGVAFFCMYLCYTIFLDRLGEIVKFGLVGIHVLNLCTFFVMGSFLASLKIMQLEKKKIFLTVLLLFLALSIYFHFYNSIKHILLPLIILLIGLIPIHLLGVTTQYGDISYGIYIYSFPIQQTLMYYFKFETFYLMIWSVLLSVFFGFLSWHLIEKKALIYKNIFKNVFKFN